MEEDLGVVGPPSDPTVRTIARRSGLDQNALGAMLIVLPICIAVGLAFVIFVGDRANPPFLTGLDRQVGLIAAAVLLLFSVIVLTMTYLQTGFERNRLRLYSSEIAYTDSFQFRNANRLVIEPDEIENLEKTVVDLRSEVTRLSDSFVGMTEQKKAELVDSVSSQIKDSAGANLWQELQDKAAASFRENERDRDLSSQFAAARGRLGQEVTALGWRGNLNLALGGIATLLGLIILGYFVVVAADPSKQPVDFAIHFMPRLSLVIFVEIFAYFFLRLYKASLSEIKYFQNEITNMEAKYIALRTALNIGDTKIIGEVVAQFGNTERNHVLEKGQTTVEIEKSRIEKDGLADIAKQLASLIPKKS